MTSSISECAICKQPVSKEYSTVMSHEIMYFRIAHIFHESCYKSMRDTFHCPACYAPLREVIRLDSSGKCVEGLHLLCSGVNEKH